jgi:hypothetical protein
MVSNLFVIYTKQKEAEFLDKLSSAIENEMDSHIDKSASGKVWSQRNMGWRGFGSIEL